MVTRFNFDPQALEDLIELHDLIAARSPERAERWQAGLLAAIESLKSLPNRCPVAPESRSAAAPVRELLYGPGSKKRVAYRIPLPSRRRCHQHPGDPAWRPGLPTALID